MNIVYMHISVVLACFSVFFDSNIFQLLGFLFAFLFVLSQGVHTLAFFFVVFLSVGSMLFDGTAMGSKTILLLFFYYQSKLKPIAIAVDYGQQARFNRVARSLFVISIFATVIQLFLGVGNTGLFGLVRGSAFFWDPNYLVILLLSLVFIYGIDSRFLMVYMMLGQTLTSLVAYAVYRIKPILNLVTLIVLILMYFFIQEIDLSAVSADSWLGERIYSFSLRVDMLQSFISGDLLTDAAPHMSFMSGFKKNPFSTIFFFAVLPFICRDRKILTMFLVISMTYDVFFGPLCFIIPFAINSVRRELPQGVAFSK